MIDELTRDLLQECVRRESRSLLQYVREVPVWVSPADRPTLAKFRALVLAEQQATDDLGRFLQKKRAGLSSLGPYPSSYTTFNDAALHHLLPRLVREQESATESLEADLARVTDAEARTYLERLVTLKRQHLSEMASFSAKPHTVNNAPAGS